MYYRGEAFSAEQPQAFTCPFCGKMGFTETTLQEHVTAEHPDTSIEVVSYLDFEKKISEVFISGLPWHREFGSPFFQTEETQVNCQKY